MRGIGCFFRITILKKNVEFSQKRSIGNFFKRTNSSSSSRNGIKLNFEDHGIPDVSNFHNSNSTLKLPFELKNGEKELKDPFQDFKTKWQSSDAQRYINTEIKYTQDVFEGNSDQLTKLRSEVLTNERENSFDPAEISVDGFSYFYIEKKHGVAFGRKNLETGEEQELLNEIETKHLQKTLVSPSGEFFAYALRDGAAEHLTLFVKHINLKTKTSVLKINQVLSFEFNPDSKSIIYTTPDQHGRPICLWSLKLTGNDSPLKIYEESDPSFFVHVMKTKDGKFILMNCNSKTTSEVHLVDQKSFKLILLHQRKTGVECFFDHTENRFLMVTNEGSVMKGYKVSWSLDDSIFEILNKHESEKNSNQNLNLSSFQNIWNEIKLESNISLTDVELFSKQMVFFGEDTITRKPLLRVIDFEMLISGKGAHSFDIPLPDEFLLYKPLPNINPNSTFVQFSAESPVLRTVLEYEFETKKLFTFMPTSDGSSYNGVPISHFLENMNIEFKNSLYWVEQNGVKIPLTIIHHKDLDPLNLPENHDFRVLMRVYGAYGQSADVSFDGALMPLLKRGYLVCIAHVRGGGELGREWYEQGRVLNKKNGVEDMKACCNWLIERKIAKKGQLVGSASSAGAVVLGAVLNENPEFFGKILFKVPFLELISSLLDKDLALTVHEYDEWGNPYENAKTLSYLISYDPYFNLENLFEKFNNKNNEKRNFLGNFPSMMITASKVDTRVPFWIPLKYVSKMRYLLKKSKISQQRLVFDIFAQHTHGDLLLFSPRELLFLLEDQKGINNQRTTEAEIVGK